MIDISINQQNVLQKEDKIIKKHFLLIYSTKKIDRFYLKSEVN